MNVLSASFRTLSYSRRCSYPNLNKDYSNSSVENNAEDLSGFINMKNAKPAHLIGHSYGAFVALYYAYKHPENVRSLVLIEPYVPSILIADPQNRLQMLSLLLRKPSVALAARNFLTKSLNPALKYLDQGNEEKAVEAFLDGVQGKADAISQLTNPVKLMMLNNAGTIKELTLKPPPFTNKEAKTISVSTLLINGSNTQKPSLQLQKSFQKISPKFKSQKFPIQHTFRTLKIQKRLTQQLQNSFL